MEESVKWFLDNYECVRSALDSLDNGPPANALFTRLTRLQDRSDGQPD